MEDVYYNPSDPGIFGGIKKKDIRRKKRPKELALLSEHILLTQSGSQIVP